MARNNRKAFTLVEMLVVIVIITMLVALLVPAVIGARARARRVSCMNRMSEAGKAIAQYEAAKGYLPGYVNRIGTNRFSSVASSNNLSWVVVTLEYMGRADLWKDWRSGAGSRTPVEFPEVVCPSDTERRGTAGTLSFAVNCGISNEAGAAGEYKTIVPDAYDQSAWGLFFDHDDTGLTAPAGLRGTKIVKIGLDEIGDGAQQTIMLSENLKRDNRWTSDRLAVDSSGAVTSGTVLEQSDVGVVWWSNVSTLSWASDIPTKVHINAETTGRYEARPSSNHPGGVNVVFADGHSDFIADRVDYTVFRDQMISDQTKAAPLIP